MPELVQRIDLKEIVEVLVTCPKCSTALMIPLQKCCRPSLRCPCCDHDLRGSSTQNHLGSLAIAIQKIQEESSQPGGVKHEFILRSPTKS